MVDPTVERSANRFEIRIEGRRAGFTEFAERDRERIFFHTEIDQAYQGRGLSAVLIEQALTNTRDAGLRIVPVCPAVAGYLRKHREFADAVDPISPDIISWLRNVLA
jgi:predicted GNAT family acetyltransferase